MRAYYRGQIYQVTQIIWDWSSRQDAPAWICLDFTKFIPADKADLMQTTRFKDKANKGMWEGDRVKVDGIPEPGIIKWIGSGLTIVFDNYKDMEINQTTAAISTVIGTMYDMLKA